MDERRFTELAEEVTIGLQDDQELQLDVQTEVLAHLEDAAYQHITTDGKSESESVDLTLRTFGSPLEVADKLLQGNKGRMRHRALLRLAVRAVLVPLAMLFAVWVGYGTLARMQHIMASRVVELQDIALYPYLQLPSLSPASPQNSQQPLERLLHQLQDPLTNQQNGVDYLLGPWGQS